MAEVRKQADGSVITETDFRLANKNVSFPDPLTEESLGLFGYDKVFDGTKPTPSTVYEEITRDGVEQISGKWYSKFVITTGDTSTIDGRAAKAEREKRNNLLTETDFYALSDVTMSDEMKTYRQALRDLSSASGWPHTHSFPTKPS